MLQWARANGCHWDMYPGQTCMGAAEGGHLAVLQWLRANGCNWTAYTCEVAAMKGHLAVLQWARANGCAWDRGNCLQRAPPGSETCEWIEAQPEPA